MEGYMGKMLLLFSLVCLTILYIGTAFFPQNPSFWLASGASMYQQVREILAFVLILQLTTRPPRHIWFRVLSGAVAVVIGAWSIEATYSNQMLFLDTLCFVGGAVAVGVATLERKTNASLAIMPSSNKKALAHL
jgi:hypothetical protein